VGSPVGHRRLRCWGVLRERVAAQDARCPCEVNYEEGHWAAQGRRRLPRWRCQAATGAEEKKRTYGIKRHQTGVLADERDRRCCQRSRIAGPPTVGQRKSTIRCPSINDSVLIVPLSRSNREALCGSVASCPRSRC
jgi:hypothetical protein